LGIARSIEEGGGLPADYMRKRKTPPTSIYEIPAPKRLKIESTKSKSTPNKSPKKKYLNTKENTYKK